MHTKQRAEACLLSIVGDSLPTLVGTGTKKISAHSKSDKKIFHLEHPYDILCSKSYFRLHFCYHGNQLIFEFKFEISALENPYLDTEHDYVR